MRSASGISFKSAHGKFLCAEIDHAVIANRSGTGPWERWAVEIVGPDLVALKSHHGSYLCAEGGGEGLVIANRDAVGPWETWRVVPQAAGRIALQAHDGVHVLCAESDGRVVANRTAIGSWETWQVEPADWLDAGGSSPGPTPGGRALTGPLSVKGSGFLDGAGQPVIPVACHFGEAFSAFVHCRLGNHVNGRSLEDWRQQCQRIAAHYPIIRSWNVLGYYSTGWGGRDVTPYAFESRERTHVAATVDYYEHYVAFYEELERLGLMNMDDRGDLNAWPDERKYTHMRRMGQVLNERLGRDRALKLMAGLWAVNEAAHNGLDDPAVAKRMLREFQGGAGWWPAVRGLSDYDQSEELEMLRAWSEDPATVVTVHALRAASQVKRMLEHYFTNGYGACRIIGKPGWSTEPIGGGPDVTVDRTDDVEYLCALHLNTAIGGMAVTFMSSPGVFWKSDIDQAPGFADVPAAIALLPQDIGHFDIVKHAGVSNASVRPLIADDSQGSRFDYAIDSRTGRFAGLAYSEHGAVPMEVARAFRAQVYHPETRAVEWESDVRAGQRLPLSGRIARLVIGQLA